MTALSEFFRSKSGTLLSAAVGLAAALPSSALAEEGIAMERDTALCIERVDVLYEHFETLQWARPHEGMTHVDRFNILKSAVTNALSDPRLTSDEPEAEISGSEDIFPPTAKRLREVFRSINADLREECETGYDLLLQEFADLSTVVVDSDPSAERVVNGFMAIVTDAFVKENISLVSYEQRLVNLTENAAMEGK